MSVTQGSVPETSVEGEQPESCPLCGERLRAEQDWCMKCGAAAKTRLAAPSKWKVLVAAVVVVVAICLAVLTAALVKLAG